MSYVPLEKLVKKSKEGTVSVFKLVLMAAARANELAQGAQPLVSADTKKVSTISLLEIAEGKVRYDEIKAKAKSGS